MRQHLSLTGNDLNHNGNFTILMRASDLSLYRIIFRGQFRKPHVKLPRYGRAKVWNFEIASEQNRDNKLSR